MSCDNCGTIDGCLCQSEGRPTRSLDGPGTVPAPLDTDPGLCPMYGCAAPRRAGETVCDACFEIVLKDVRFSDGPEPEGWACGASAEQPAPTPNDWPPVWDTVIADMTERKRIGYERYGTHLQPFNGRDPLTDGYQEALDLAVYLCQARREGLHLAAVRKALAKELSDLIGGPVEATRPTSRYAVPADILVRLLAVLR